jgi:hypothetical protein
MEYICQNISLAATPFPENSALLKTGPEEGTHLPKRSHRHQPRLLKSLVLAKNKVIINPPPPQMFTPHWGAEIRSYLATNILFRILHNVSQGE